MLRLGRHVVDPPVVLAPMAGVTNVAFRQLCREQGGGLFVCEMVTSRALVERSPKTLRMATFAPDESPRSLQLYGVDPAVVAQAVAIVVDGNLADHIDLNFGCPVPKVTRKGGGAALPWRWRLFERIVRAAAGVAGPAGIPVTVKLRLGVDDEHLTYRRAGRIAQDAGAAAVTLHARTALQGYSGAADWSAIGELKASLEIPVLGNGDVWEASDALRMVAQTGADGIVVGRGCLGRPWLFADLAAAFGGRLDRGPRLPSLGEVGLTMRRHAQLLVEWFGDEQRGCADFRKHVAWYLRGFGVGGDLRRRFAGVASLTELDGFLGELDPQTPYPDTVLGRPRGRVSAPPRVYLPEGWLDDPDADEVPEGAELAESGG